MHGLLGSGLCFSFNTEQKAPQTQSTAPENTLDSPPPDSLCRHHLGEGLVQQLQAVQDPVAEPRAAGVQTLAHGAGRKHTPYSEPSQETADKGMSVCLLAAWRGQEGTLRTLSE